MPVDEVNFSDTNPAALSGRQNCNYQGSTPYADPVTGKSVRDLSLMPPPAAAGLQGAIALSGDIGGSAGTPKVVAIQGVGVSATAPTNGQVLQYDSGSGLYLPTTPASGGGGSSFQSVYPYTAGESTSAFATKGMVATALQAITVSDIWAQVYGNNGDVYQAAILTMSSGTVISGVLATSNSFTFSATETGTIIFKFASPPTLTVGNTYFFAIEITSGSGTTACQIDTSSSAGSWITPGLTTPTVFSRIATKTPTSGTVSQGTGSFQITIVGSF